MATSGRAFFLNGSKFEWVRRDDQISYDVSEIHVCFMNLMLICFFASASRRQLYHIAHNVPTQRIATFRRVEQQTPVGPGMNLFLYRKDNHLTFLYCNPHVCLFAVRRLSMASRHTLAHGLFQYTFLQPALLLESLISLCINRWMDQNE